jgi:hypothetical protein
MGFVPRFGSRARELARKPMAAAREHRLQQARAEEERQWQTFMEEHMEQFREKGEAKIAARLQGERMQYAQLEALKWMRGAGMEEEEAMQVIQLLLSDEIRGYDKQKIIERLKLHLQRTGTGEQHAEETAKRLGQLVRVLSESH